MYGILQGLTNELTNGQENDYSWIEQQRVINVC